MILISNIAGEIHMLDQRTRNYGARLVNHKFTLSLIYVILDEAVDDFDKGPELQVMMIFGQMAVLFSATFLMQMDCWKSHAQASRDHLWWKVVLLQ